MTRRKPAEVCVVCGKTLAETGGQRLVSTYYNNFRQLRPQSEVGNLRFPCKLIRCDGNFRDVILAFLGPLWTDQIIERVRQTIQSGVRPWFCQRCGEKNICTVCGYPMSRVPGATVLLETGKIGHEPFWAGMQMRCTNKDCASRNTKE